MSRGNTWVNADGLVVGSGRRTAVNVTELDERAIDGELRLTPQQQLHLKANGDLSGVTYDSGGRAIAWTIDGVSYGTSTYTISFGDGLTGILTFDPIVALGSVEGVEPPAASLGRAMAPRWALTASGELVALF